MHTYIHTRTNAQNGKNTEFCYNGITQNSAYYVGTIRFTELRVKQVANRPAHLPRVQAPVHINMLDVGFLEFTIKGDPRTRLK